ncbi:MAG: diacylglycerol/lipid kinase family protein [Thermoplasmatota archaeon]
MKRVCLVCNEESSNSEPELLKELAEKYLDVQEKKYVFHSNPDKIDKEVEQASKNGYEIFIVAGGDGTISMVVNHIAETVAKMAVIPIGTSNTIARIMGINDDHEENIKKIAEDRFKVKKIDTLKLKDRYVSYSISIGLNSTVMKNTSSISKKFLGKGAYYFRGIIEVFKLRSHDFEISVNGKSFRTKAIDVGIYNMGLQDKISFRNISKVGPESGFAECYIFKPENVLNYISFLYDSIVQKVNTEKGYLELIKIENKITVQLPRDVPIQMDGEDVETEKFSAEIRPGSLNLVLYE